MRTLPLDAYDFVYIDGGHGTVNVLQDAVHAFPLVKIGDVIGFDDYLWDQPPWNQDGTPKAAIDAFLTIYSKEIELHHQDSQVFTRDLDRLRHSGECLQQLAASVIDIAGLQ